MILNHEDFKSFDRQNLLTSVRKVLQPYYTNDYDQIHFTTDCPSLQVTDGYVNTTDGKRYGSVASYKCTSGFILVGDENRTCEDDSMWSGTDSICVPSK